MPNNQPQTDSNRTNRLRGENELAWIQQWTDVLDTKYAIPGTKIRFGLDFILGLIPGIGDAISLSFSGVLIATMAKHGASSMLITRMLLNVLLDTVVGSIPILGSLFDLFFRANSRNLKLMREYHRESKHTGSAWPLIAGIIGTIAVFFGLLIWAVVAGAMWLVQWL